MGAVALVLAPTLGTGLAAVEPLPVLDPGGVGIGYDDNAASVVVDLLYRAPKAAPQLVYLQSHDHYEVRTCRDAHAL